MNANKEITIVALMPIAKMRLAPTIAPVRMALLEMDTLVQISMNVALVHMITTQMQRV